MLFQMSVGKSHSINYEGLLKSTKALQGSSESIPICFYFVAPPDRFDKLVRTQRLVDSNDSKKTMPSSMKQFVLKMKLDSIPEPREDNNSIDIEEEDAEQELDDEKDGGLKSRGKHGRSTDSLEVSEVEKKRRVGESS